MWKRIRVCWTESPTTSAYNDSKIASEKTKKKGDRRNEKSAVARTLFWYFFEALDAFLMLYRTETVSQIGQSGIMMLLCPPKILQTTRQKSRFRRKNTQKHQIKEKPKPFGFGYGRGRRIRTRDPRFWSGSVRLKYLDFSRFLSAVAHLFGSLKLPIFYLMLYWWYEKISLKLWLIKLFWYTPTLKFTSEYYSISNSNFNRKSPFRISADICPGKDQIFHEICGSSSVVY